MGFNFYLLNGRGSRMSESEGKEELSSNSENSSSSESSSNTSNTNSTSNFSSSENSQASDLRRNEAPDAGQEPDSRQNEAPELGQNKTSDEQATGVQIQEQVEEEEDSFVLGDRIEVETRQRGKVKGRVYYWDGELLRIIPEGLSDRVIDIEFDNGEPDPDLGVTGITFEQGPRTSFTDLQGFRIGQLLDTFTSKGDPIPNGKLKILEVSKDKDSIRIEDTTGAVREIDFKAMGIPKDETFQVIRIATIPEEQQGEEAKEGKEEEEEDQEFEILADLEMPEYQVMQGINETERIYPEINQKTDLFADLISMIPVTSQRNPQYLKTTRAVVEMTSILKNSIIDRGEDGNVKGEAVISPFMLSDILKNRTVPLIKPVLTTSRVLQSDFTDEIGGGNSLIIVGLKSTLDNIEEYSDFFQFKSAEQATAVPRWIQFIQGILSIYPMGDQFTGGDYTFSQDGEFFRNDVPGGSIEGLHPTNEPKILRNKFKKDNRIHLTEYIAPIKQSLRRGLGKTVRSVVGGGTETALPADKATVESFVLFPYKAALNGALGATRTGKLWEDIVRSSSAKQWMETLIEELGDIKEEADAQSILHLSVRSATLANISFTDYLEMVLQNIIPRGDGDLAALMNDYGIRDLEFDESQSTVIQKRVDEIIAALRATIRRLREETKEPVVTRFQPFQKDFTDTLKQKIATQPLLQYILDDLGKRMPGYKNIDLAIVGSMLLSAPDYFFTVMGGDPQKSEINKNRFMRDHFLKELSELIQLKTLEKNVGQPPKINPCQHVMNLNQIRRIKNDQERIALLAKFIQRYKGSIDGNWITCNICDLHLICTHERLQIQQYLHPREHDVIQKEIVLTFAGGRSGNSYVCRNCGIPISELDFDKNVEFDDEGRPMMGRSELVDKDAVDEEELELALKLRVNEEPELTFNTDLKKEIYKVATDILLRIGITPDLPSQNMIVERSAADISALPSKKTYEKRVGEEKEGGKSYVSYTSYLNQSKVLIVASYILLDIQTHVPDYVPRYTMEGCRAGFDGYPLVEEADPESPEKSTGIHYIACVLASINEQRVPWVYTDWQKQRSDSKRKAYILKSFIKNINNILRNSTTLQTLEKKRDALRELFGAAAAKGRPSEKVPSHFLPAQAPKKEEVVAEGARGEKGDTLLAAAWIEAVNRLAKESVKLTPSPFSEAMCCKSTLEERPTFWEKKGLPALPELYITKPPFARQTWEVTPFLPKPIVIVDATPPLELSYQVFLKLCYQGTRIGLPHELGYDHTCDWCGIVLPTSYVLPDVDKNGTPIINQEELISNLTAQGVPITTDGFQELIDIAHNRTRFDPYRGKHYSSGQEFVEELRLLDPEPVIGWTDTVEAVLKELGTMDTNTKELTLEIAQRLSPLRALLVRENAEDDEKPEDILTTKLRPLMPVLLSILKEPVPTIFEIIRSYFLVPAQRILAGFDIETLKVRNDYGLSIDHKNTLKTILDDHSDICTKFGIYTLNSEKLAHFVEQYSVILSKANEVRVQRLQFGPILLQELMRIFFFGPLGMLIDETIQADEETVAGERDVNSTKFVWECIRKYNKEKMSYSKVAVRERIKEAEEQEKQTFIDEFDKLSEEEKRMELMKKEMRIGRWAIGGTSLVYKYNKNYWDKTYKEGVGITDVLLKEGPEGQEELGGLPANYEEEGYDVEQHPEDMDD